MNKAIYALVEPNYLTPVWHAKCIAGLQDTAAKNKLRLVTLDGLEAADGLLKGIHSVIVVSTQDAWTRNAVSKLRALHVRPILIGAVPGRFGEDVSGITLNHKALIETMVHYFYSCGKRRIALLGINADASNDALKCETFLSAASFLGLDSSEKDIFYYRETSLSSHCENFFLTGGAYDGVICSNDYVAVCFLNHAKKHGVRVPEDMYAAGIGNMLLCDCVSPTLTSAARYYYETGKQAFNIWEMLEKDPSVTSITSTVPCKIICRESTAFSPLPDPIEFEPPPEHERKIPEKGPKGMEFQRLENCLLQCDPLDIKIIAGIARGEKLENLADALYISQRALRYRLNKIYASAEAGSRADLEQILEESGLDAGLLRRLLENP